MFLSAGYLSRTFTWPGFARLAVLSGYEEFNDHDNDGALPPPRSLSGAPGYDSFQASKGSNRYIQIAKTSFPGKSMKIMKMSTLYLLR